MLRYSRRLLVDLCLNDFGGFTGWLMKSFWYVDCIGVAADKKSSVIKQLPKLLFSLLLNVLLFIIKGGSKYVQEAPACRHSKSWLQSLHFYDNARLVYLILKKIRNFKICSNHDKYYSFGDLLSYVRLASAFGCVGKNPIWIKNTTVCLPIGGRYLLPW